MDDTGNGTFTYLHKTGKTMNASLRYMKKSRLNERDHRRGVSDAGGALGGAGPIRPCCGAWKILAELDRSKVSLELRLSPRKHLILDWVGFGVGRRYTVRLRRCFFQDI